MKIKVNGSDVLLFEGAMVEHAIRKYDPQLLAKVKKGLAIISDRFGNTVSLDGRLSEGDMLTIKTNEK